MIVINMRTGPLSELADAFPCAGRDDIIEHLMYDYGFTCLDAAEVESWAEIAAIGERIKVAGYIFEIEEV